MNAWGAWGWGGGGAVDDLTSEGERQGERRLEAVLGECGGTLRRFGIAVHGISSEARLVRQITPLVRTSSLWEELAVYSISPINYPTLLPTILNSLQTANRLTCLTLSHVLSFDEEAAGVQLETVTLETVRDIRYRYRIQDCVSTPNAESLSLHRMSIGGEERFRKLCRSMRHLKKIQLQAVFIDRAW